MVVDPPLGPRPLPRRVGHLRGVDVRRARLVVDVRPGRGVEVAEGAGGEERDAAEEAAALVLVQEVDDGLTVGGGGEDVTQTVAGGLGLGLDVRCGL